MQPKDWMGVVVRGLGLWFILQGVLSFFSLVVMSIQTSPDTQGWTPKDYVLSIIMYVGVGLIAIGCAEVICGLLYPNREPKAPPEP